MWEVVGTEPGSESGREGKRDHLVPEDSRETAIPVSLWVSVSDRQRGTLRKMSVFLAAVAKALKHRLAKGNQIRAVCSPITSS